MSHHLQTRFLGVSSGMITCQKPSDSLLLETWAYIQPLVLSICLFSIPAGEDRNKVDKPLTLHPLGFAFLQASPPLLLRVEERKGPPDSKCPPHHGADLPARMGKSSSSFPLTSQGHMRPFLLSPLSLEGVTLGSILQWKPQTKSPAGTCYGTSQEPLRSSLSLCSLIFT